MQAPPEPPEELVGEVAQSGAVVVAGGSSFVVVGTCAR